MTRPTTLLALGIAAMMAVGRVYDPRLSFAGLNVSLFVSAAFALGTLLVALGVVGPGATETRGRHAARGLFVAPMLLLGVWAAVHVILVPSSDAAYAQEKLATLACITLPAGLVVAQQRSPALVRALTFALAGVGGVLLVLSLPSIGAALAGQSGYGRAAVRLSLFGGGPIVYARWVLTAALVVALSRAPLAARVSVVLVALLAALLAQSKGPVLFFGVSLGLVALLRAAAQRRFMRAAGVVGVAAGLVAVAPRVIEALGLGRRLLTLFDPAGLLTATSSTARLDLLRVASDLLRDHPFGVGLGNWATVAGRYAVTGTVLPYPHNLFVEVAAELGVGLAVALSGWVAWCAARGVRTLAAMVRQGDAEAPLGLTALALVTFYLLNSLVSGDLSDARLLFVALAMLTVVAGRRRARTAAPRWSAPAGPPLALTPA